MTAVAVLPEAQGALALTGGQDTALLLSSIPALSAGAADNGASAAAQPLVAYRCGTPPVPRMQQEGALPESLRAEKCTWCALGVHFSRHEACEVTIVCMSHKEESVALLCKARGYDIGVGSQ